MARDNPEFDAKMRAEGWWKAREIAAITGLSNTTVRRAAEGFRKRKIDPYGKSERGWVWVYYHIDSVLLWLGPEVGPQLAPKFGVGVEVAQKLTAHLKGQPRRRSIGRPTGVERLGPPPAPEELRPVVDVIEPGREDPAHATSHGQD